MKTRIKRLIMGLALSLVFVGGAFVNANAQCATCLPQVRVQPPAQATCQGAFHYGPSAPTPFGSVGGASGG